MDTGVRYTPTWRIDAELYVPLLAPVVGDTGERCIAILAPITGGIQSMAGLALGSAIPGTAQARGLAYTISTA
jgi:hypothetical protein